MGKLFSNMTSEGLPEAEDRLGGGRQLPNTGVYEGIKSKLVFVGKSDKGAHFMRILLDLGDGKEHEETIYFTNKDGENFYTKDGKKNQMPGFVTVNEFCLAATGEELSDQDFEERQIEVWDNEAKKKVRQAREVCIGLTDVTVSVALMKFIENQSDKQEDGTYKANDKTREGAEIKKSFHPETRCTVAEIKKAQKDGKDPAPVFIDEWAAKYSADYVQDKREKGNGTAKTVSNGAPPKAGDSKPKTSLFAK